MREIGDIHRRLLDAFSRPAADRGLEETPEQLVVPSSSTERRGPAARTGLFTHFSKLMSWRNPQRGEPDPADMARARQIANVVHEIRTPLNGILGMSHLLGQTKLSAEQQNYLSAIRQSGYALAQLVEDLLDQATLETGYFRLNNRAADLRQLIESVVELLAPRAHGKRIEIAATISANLPDLLDLDPARLRQVLFNVIGNAVKFTGSGGVLVRATREGETVAIAVVDTGPGMTVSEQKRIFGEFEQAGDAAQRSGGTGLGLGISARILTEFGGSLSVSSRKGIGSTFTIRFPMLLAEDAAAGEADRGRALSRSRVLLLAPEGPSAQAIVASIETLGGHCRHVSEPGRVSMLIDRLDSTPDAYSDLIVDHRLASEYACEPAHGNLHRILLVNPEERASQPQDFFDAWLIRPLREKSLIDVLSGRMRGFGRRQSFTEAQPVAPTAPPTALQEERPEPGLGILLGEDDPVSAMMIAAVLRKAGHRVVTVDDFATLSETVGRSGPDLVICDMHMPGGTLAAFLKASGEGVAQPVPVIVQTGNDCAETTDKLLELGASVVLHKPVEPAALLEQVRLFGRTRSQLQQVR